eukprot:gene12897-7316_t
MKLMEIKPNGIKFPGCCGHKMSKYGDNIYIFGGFSALYLDMDSVYFYVYNIPTNTTRTIEVEVDIPYYLVGYSMIYHKDHFYMLLGLNNDLMIYDIKNEKMKKQYIKGPPENYAQTAVLIRDKVIVFGGINYVSLVLTNETYSLCLETLTWKNLTKECKGEIPTPRNYHSSVAWNNKKYIFGGIGGEPSYTNLFRFSGGQHFNDIHSFDPSTNSWEIVHTKMNIKPQKRRSHSSCCLNDKMYIFGGHFEEQENEENAFNDCWYFDFFLNSWTEVELSQKYSERRLHSTISEDKNIWIFGGITVHNGVFNLHDDFFRMREENLISKKTIKQNLMEMKSNSKYIDVDIFH